MKYHRKIEKHLLRLATEYPVLTITGPRQSGKTTLVKYLFPQYDYCNLEDIELREFAKNDPKGFMAQYQKGLIIDEIQRVPELVSYIQIIVDDEQTAGRFVLTGSQQFEMTQAINQSLAGRTALAKLLPLTIDEIYSDEAPSFEKLIYDGFYPRIHDKHLNPTENLSFYLNTYVERDIRTMLNIRNLNAFDRFLRLCATQVGQILNYSTLANDTGIDQGTIKSWISILEASYILFTLKPHHANYRKRLIKSSKLYFYDVGLAAYLLGIQSPQQVLTHPLKGLLFENLIVSDLLKNRFNNIQNNNLYYFRDQSGKEVDLILDHGLTVSCVEIKSTQTVKTSLFDNLHYYQKLAGKNLTQAYMAYGGPEDRRQNDVEVISYRHLEKIV